MGLKLGAGQYRAKMHVIINSEIFKSIGVRQFGDTIDYTEIEKDGTIEFLGEATTWDDIQVGISNIRIPVANAPTERLYNHGIGGGVTFPVLGFALNNYLYFDVQTSHSMKLSTILNNHIHFILPNTTNIGDKFKFQLDVIVAGINVAFAAPAGTPFTAEHTIVANDNTTHRLLNIANVPAANTTISTLYSCRFTRVAASANEYASEVYIKYIDCHYEKDSTGSREIASK